MEPMGYLRSRPLRRGKEYLDHLLQHLDFARVQQKIEAAAQVRQRNLSRRLPPVIHEAAWKPQGRMTMSVDKSLALHNIVNFVLGAEWRSEWEVEGLCREIAGFVDWKRACVLWRQPGWVFKRVAVAAASRDEPPMAMFLDQPLIVAAPFEPIEAVESADTALRPEQSGEPAANAALVEPIDNLNLNTDTEILVSSPRRRASVGDGVSATEPSWLSAIVKNLQCNRTVPKKVAELVRSQKMLTNSSKLMAKHLNIH